MPANRTIAVAGFPLKLCLSGECILLAAMAAVWVILHPAHEFYTAAVVLLIAWPLLLTHWPPPVRTAECKQFRKELSTRVALSDEEFYARFFDAAEMPREIPTRIRHALRDIDPLMNRVISTDFLYELEDELDMGDVIYLLEDEFGIQFQKTDYSEIDWSLGSVIRLVKQQLDAHLEHS